MASKRDSVIFANDRFEDSDIEPPESQKSKYTHKFSNNPALINLFTGLTRSGDGSNPFKRHESTYTEYRNAFINLVTKEGESRCEINLHGLNSCLVTTLHNMTEIIDVI